MSGALPLVAIRQAIEEAVASVTLPPSFRTLLRIPLQQPGKALHHADTPSLWPAAVLAASNAAHGDPRRAVRVAAAVELFMAALDVFDEVEDDDRSATVEAAGVPQAINVATALLLLAQQTLLALLAEGLAADRVMGLTRILVGAGLEATGGQHRDLASEGDRQLSSADALAIARLKAGALAGGAVALGAALGTEDAELLALYRDWGRHFGTLAQIANDMRDAGSSVGKSDAARNKGTLPLIFARGDESDDEAIPPNADTLAASGALHFAWVIREIERQECETILAQLATRGQRIETLHALLAMVG